MGRSHLAGFALVAMTVGCTGATLTRTTTLTPSQLEHLGPRARVVSRHGDAITAEVDYGDKDEIPGEGIVRVTPDNGTIVGGAIALAAGVALVVAGVEVGSSCQSTGNQLFSPCIGNGFAALGLDVLGGILGITGIVLLASGVAGTARVERSAPRVHVAPAIGRGTAGATLELRF